MFCTQILSLFTLASSSLVWLGGPPVELRLQPTGSTGPFSIITNEIHVQPGAQRVTIELRISDWDPDLNGDPTLGTVQVQILPTTLSTGTAGTLSMAGDACANNAQCVALHGSGSSCNMNQCDAMFATMTRPDWVYAGGGAIAVFDRTSASRFRYGIVPLGAGPVDTGAVKYAGTMLLDVPANAEGTFTIAMSSTFETFVCSDDQPPVCPIPSVSFPALIVIDPPAPGRCCFDIGPGTTQCQNGLLPSQCSAQPAPRIFTAGATCAQGCPACVADQDCDDESFCNGPETCVSGSCQNGSPPICDDQDSCTIDFCNSGTDACDASPDPKCPETGSCCHASIQACFDDVLATDCIGPLRTFSSVQTCAQVNCTTLSGLMLLPVHSSGPFAVSGNTINVFPGVQRITFDLFVSGWDPSLPVLKTYQVAVPQTALTSGTAGALNRLNVPCTNDAQCVAALGPGAACNVPESKCNTMFADMTRPDWVFEGIDALNAADSFSNPDRVRFGATTLESPGGVPDLDATRYAGTLMLDATSDAAGVFTIALEGTPHTFWCNVSNNCILPPSLLPGIVNVDPAGLGACCSPGGSCEHQTSGNCGGAYQGDGTTCSPNPCPQPTCGDGVVNQPSEECDVPDTSGCGPNEVCQPNCTCTCTCSADVLPPHGPFIQFLDVAHVVDCAEGNIPPASCQADDINCDGQVTHCDVSVAVRQFNGFAGGCEIPCGACCQEDGTCLQEQQFLCDGDPLFPQLAGVYQGDGTTCTLDTCAPPPPLPSVSDRCQGGPNNGQVCGNSNQCTGGICQKTDRCDGGTQHGAPCASDADCPGGLCGTKSAYISINPSTAALRGGSVASGPIQAIQVKLVDLPEFPNCNGQIRWVGPPQSYLEDVGGGTFLGSQTQTLEFYSDWSAIANLHIFGDAVVPGSTYEVRMCAPGPICSGTPLSITTTVWADVVAPYGHPLNPNFLDISAVLDKFKVLPGRLEKTRTQLQPSPPDPSDPVNFLDISAAVSSFKGASYSDFYPGPSGCP